MSIIKRILTLCLVVAIILVASGCQRTPERSAVTSKNDGSFEEAVSATMPPVLVEDEFPEEPKMISDSYSSTDGSIQYTVELERPIFDDPMPLVQVTPHSFTSEEVKSIARALFGDSEIYEYSEEMSKTELEEIILDIKARISDWDGLVEYYGDEASAQAMLERYEEQIEAYSEMYEDAPDNVEPKLCDWEFRPISYYEDVTMLQSNADFESYNKSLYVKGTTVVNGMPYMISACNRDEDDYRIHNVFAYLDLPGSTGSHYSPKEATEEDRQEIIQKVETILSDIGIGDWSIYSCEIGKAQTWDEEYNVDFLYHIYVKAAREYSGLAVTPQKQLMNLKSDDAYASNYYYESITFDFSDGELIAFEYQAPLDVVSIINEDVDVLSLDEVMEKLKSHLELSTIYNPDPLSLYNLASSAEFMIERVELGAVRTRIKNNETDFYMVPAYTFYGNYNVYDSSGGIIDSSMDFGTETVIAVVNAVDGSIINTQLGY